MIKENELRIGNLLVDYKGDVHHVCKRTIWTISEVTNHGYEPIPLTSEWLGKLGFADEDKNVFTKERLKIGLDDNGGANWVFYFEQHLSLHSMSYVHQLQNLYFALLGEELAIKVLA